MRASTSPFMKSICTSEQLLFCTDCNHEFVVDSSLVLTSTLKNGTLLVAYKGYPVDEEGLALIPDDETLKEALFHFVLYNY